MVPMTVGEEWRPFCFAQGKGPDQWRRAFHHQLQPVSAGARRGAGFSAPAEIKEGLRLQAISDTSLD